MLLRRAVCLFLTAALGGCVLFVDTFDTTENCGIQGGGECAQCLRKNCQTPINRCCNQNECLGGRMLGTMDACGNGDNASCADVLNSPRLQKEEEELRACAKASCGQICTQGSSGTGGNNRPEWTCSTPRNQDINCSACIYQKCATSIEACCSDSSCQNEQGIRSDMAACVSGDAPGCAYLLERSTSGQAGVLRKCIDTQCGTACMGDRLPHTDCDLFSGGEYCQCSNSETSGTTTCRAETVDGTCVLGTEGCTCGQYSCRDDTVSEGCGCTFYGGVTGTTCTAPTDKVCCAERDTYSIKCECKYSTCSNALRQTQVPSCALEDILAEFGSVSSCSR